MHDYTSIDISIVVAIAGWLGLCLWSLARPLGRAQAWLATLPFLSIALACLVRVPVVAIWGDQRLVMVSTLLITFLLAFSALQGAFALISFASARMNRQQRVARERAQAAAQTKARFLSNMSHELRTPLNGILGMAQVLADRSPDPETRTITATIQRSGEDPLAILSDILDLAAIESGHLTLAPGPLVPIDPIQRALRLHRARAADKGLALRVALGPGLDRRHHGDGARILQVLHHILGHAVKFTAAGQVTPEARIEHPTPAPPAAGQGPQPPPPRLVIAVSDTGIGMNAAELAQVFDGSVQAEGGFARRFDGLGLGLAMAQQRVTLMGGTIRADSAPGRGTRIEVALPLPHLPVPDPAAGAQRPEAASPQQTVAPPSAPAPVAAPVPAPASAPARARPDTRGPSPGPDTEPDPAAAGALAGLRLLLAEDNLTNQRVIQGLLARTGADLTIVGDGRRAVARVSEADARGGGGFDLLRFDISMPEMDGSTALATIGRDRGARGLPPPRAIALTAHVLPEQVASYGKGGFLDCLPKPVRRGDLVAAIARRSARG